MKQNVIVVKKMKCILGYMHGYVSVTVNLCLCL